MNASKISPGPKPKLWAHPPMRPKIKRLGRSESGKENRPVSMSPPPAYSPAVDLLQWHKEAQKISELLLVVVLSMPPRKAKAGGSSSSKKDEIQVSKSPAEFFAENQSIAGFDNPVSCTMCSRLPSTLTCKLFSPQHSLSCLGEISIHDTSWIDRKLTGCMWVGKCVARYIRHNWGDDTRSV